MEPSDPTPDTPSESEIGTLDVAGGKVPFPPWAATLFVVFQIILVPAVCGTALYWIIHGQFYDGGAAEFRDGVIVIAVMLWSQIRRY